MRNMRSKIAAAALFAACASPAAAAVKYDFVATSSYGGASGSFSFTTADYINSASSSGTYIAIADLTSCSVTFGGGTCGTQLLLNNASQFTAQPADAISFGTALGRGAAYYFADGALTREGSYSSLLFGSAQAATLRVSLVPTGGAVPEPATWAMMLVGFGAMGTAIRRRRSTVATLAQA
jgi:PEP-CTERM motif